MGSKNRFKLLLVLLTICLTACGGGGGLRIITQAAPNPLQANAQFVLRPFVKEQLLVSGKTLDQFLADKEMDDERAAFCAAQERMEIAFARGLQTEMTHLGLGRITAASNAPGSFWIQVNVERIEPGYNYYVSSRPASAQMTIRITDDQQQIVDELFVDIRTGSSLGQHVIERFERIGETSGVRLGRYLSRRIVR